MTCAIVGDGLAALVGYATLRRGGLEPDEIAVFGTDPDPASAWRVRAAAIRQRRMRSESDGHVAATSFPGLAVRRAARRPWSLVETLLDRYHPTVDEFLEHVESVRRESGWDTSFRRARVERVAPIAGGFELDGTAYPHDVVTRSTVISITARRPGSSGKPDASSSNSAEPSWCTAPVP